MYRSSQRLVQNLHSLYNEEDDCSEKKGALQTLRAGYPMQIVWDPFPETEDGCEYVLVASDCFTRLDEVRHRLEFLKHLPLYSGATGRNRHITVLAYSRVKDNDLLVVVNQQR
ncbi:hypothetical protein EMCRGX_G006747 [Ephydatia muelleri]